MCDFEMLSRATVKKERPNRSVKIGEVVVRIAYRKVCGCVNGREQLQLATLLARLKGWCPG